MSDKHSINLAKIELNIAFAALERADKAALSYDPTTGQSVSEIEHRIAVNRDKLPLSEGQIVQERLNEISARIFNKTVLR